MDVFFFAPLFRCHYLFAVHHCRLAVKDKKVLSSFPEEGKKWHGMGGRKEGRKGWGE